MNRNTNTNNTKLVEKVSRHTVLVALKKDEVQIWVWTSQLPKTQGAWVNDCAMTKPQLKGYLYHSHYIVLKKGNMRIYLIYRENPKLLERVSDLLPEAFKIHISSPCSLITEVFDGKWALRGMN